MQITIRTMTAEDMPRVLEIFQQGIDTEAATFVTEAPSADAWDQKYIKDCRLVAQDENGTVQGWAALILSDKNSYAYRGVMELSLYVAESGRRQGIGKALTEAIIKASERAGIWMLQSRIMQINEASIALHKACGFRVVGVRERIGMDRHGNWLNTVLMERRSDVVGV